MSKGCCVSGVLKDAVSVVCRGVKHPSVVFRGVLCQWCVEGCCVSGVSRGVVSVVCRGVLCQECVEVRVLCQ